MDAGGEELKVGSGTPGRETRPTGGSWLGEATLPCGQAARGSDRRQSCDQSFKTCMKSGQFGSELTGETFAIDMNREDACLDGVVPQNLIVYPTETKCVFKGLPRPVGLKPFLTRQPLDVFPSHFVGELKPQYGSITITIGSRQMPCSQRLAPSTNDCLEIIPLLSRQSHRRVLRPDLIWGVLASPNRFLAGCREWVTTDWGARLTSPNARSMAARF